MGNVPVIPEVKKIVKEKFKNYDGTAESFQAIEKTLSKQDKAQMGKYYEVWKLGCLYKLMCSTSNDLESSASEIIAQFEEMEGEILSTKSAESKMGASILYLATKDQKYAPYVDSELVGK